MASRDRIAGFDGLRAIAFLLVFISHKTPIDHRGAYGDMGVWIFFALSGFLITRILASSREEVETGGLPGRWALARFYTRRTARIFPIYYLVLAIGQVISTFITVEGFWRPDKIAFIFFVTNIHIGMGNWVRDFGHLWTLAVEEQFYLLFAPLVLLTPRSRTWMLCLGFVVIALAAKLIMEAMGAPEPKIDVSSWVNFGLLGLGGLVGLAALRPHRSWLMTGWAQAAMCAGLIALPLVFGRWADTWMTYAKASGVLAALLLFQVAQGQNTWFVAVLNSAPLRLLGRVSYAAYLFHPFIYFHVLQVVLSKIGVGLTAPEPIRILTEFVITIVLATVSWRLVERPILDWAARTTRRAPFTPARQPAAASA